MGSKLNVLGQSPYLQEFFEIDLWILSHLASQFKTPHMKLRLPLILFCLLGAGLFAHSQNKKKTNKPTVENGLDAIPVTVQSHKKAHHRKPPPPPQIVRDKMPPPPPPLPDKDGKPLPPPKVEITKFAPPKIVKDKMPPPPPPAKHTKAKPSAPDAPPPPPEKTEL
jgi:hypothetical protein